MNLHFKLKWWPFRNITLISTDWGKRKGQNQIGRIIGCAIEPRQLISFIEQKIDFSIFFLLRLPGQSELPFSTLPNLWPMLVCALEMSACVCVCVCARGRECVCVHGRVRAWVSMCVCQCERDWEKSNYQKAMGFFYLSTSQKSALSSSSVAFLPVTFFRFLGSSGIKPVFYGGTTLTRSS